MTVYAKVYTKENICEGLPKDAWEYRLMADPEQPGRVILVEAMWLLPRDGAVTHGYSEARAENVVYSEYARVQKEDPEGYEFSYEENFTPCFNRLFTFESNK